jgi:hypothetical protein
MVRIDIDLTDDGAECVDRMAETLGASREEVIRQSFAFFEDVIMEILDGRVICTVPRSPNTFHDWNFGSYDPKPVRLLTVWNHS